MHSHRSILLAIEIIRIDSHPENLFFDLYFIRILLLFSFCFQRHFNFFSFLIRFPLSFICGQTDGKVVTRQFMTDSLQNIVITNTTLCRKSYWFTVWLRKINLIEKYYNHQYIKVEKKCEVDQVSYFFIFIYIFFIGLRSFVNCVRLILPTNAKPFSTFRYENRRF